MNIIEAVKLLKTGKKIKRKGERYREHHYETYDIKKGWLIFFLEEDILADDWEVVEDDEVEVVE